MERGAVPSNNQDGRLGHAVRIARLFGNSNIDQAPFLELGRKEVLRVDNGIAAVSGLGARCSQVRCGLGGHDDGVAVGAYDLVFQRPEAFEVGEAEGTPVPAIVCRMRVLVSVFACAGTVGYVQTTKRNEADPSRLSNCSMGFDMARDMLVMMIDLIGSREVVQWKVLSQDEKGKEGRVG